MNVLSEEYVRGLVEGEGCFTFDPRKYQTKNGTVTYKIPAFAIAMNERDANLLKLVRDTMNLSLIDSHSIYINNTSNKKDGYFRSRMARLIVRDYISIKDKIIPFFYKKLYGHKNIQFNEWLNKMGSRDVPPSFRHIYYLYRSGYYDKNNTF